MKTRSTRKSFKTKKTDMKNLLGGGAAGGKDKNAAEGDSGPTEEELFARKQKKINGWRREQTELESQILQLQTAQARKDARLANKIAPEGVHRNRAVDAHSRTNVVVLNLPTPPTSPVDASRPGTPATPMASRPGTPGNPDVFLDIESSDDDDGFDL